MASSSRRGSLLVRACTATRAAFVTEMSKLCRTSPSQAAFRLGHDFPLSMRGEPVNSQLTVVLAKATRLCSTFGLVHWTSDFATCTHLNPFSADQLYVENGADKAT